VYGRNHMGDLGIDGTIILKQIIIKERVWVWTGFI
jgi:hypothetical protein